MRYRRIILLAAATLLPLMVGGSGEAQAPMSNRCFTPSFWCWLPGFAPIGMPCYCGTPYGPIQGRVG